jgi:phosphatidylserine synthase
LAQRGRKKKQRKPRPAAPAAAEPSPMARGYSRTEAKNQAVRESLVPLEEGERPLPVTIGAITALVLVVVQVPLYFVWNGDQRPALSGFLFFTALMLVMAWGMWNVKYWAVLGFQALLALTILIVALSLMVASDLLTVLICLAIIVPSAALFWFMVKALARIQMPERG